MYNQKFLDSLAGLTEGQARAACKKIKHEVKAYRPDKILADMARENVIILCVEKGKVLAASPGDPTKLKK
jgi:hypothetical protein